MTCAKCGAALPEDARFCGECGQPRSVPSVEPPTVSIPVPASDPAPAMPPPSGPPPAPIAPEPAPTPVAETPPAAPAVPPPTAAPVESTWAPAPTPDPAARAPEATWAPASGMPPTGPPPTSPPEVPVYAGAATAPPGDGGRKRVPGAVKMVVGLVAVAVVVGVGLAVYLGLSGEGEGAGSPDEAVERVAASLDEDDILGVLASLDPEEVGPLVEVTETALQRSDELELLRSSDTGLRDLDIKLEDLQFTVEELRPEIARVTITGGSIGADFTAPDLGLAFASDDQANFTEAASTHGESALADLFTGEEGGGTDSTFVMTVKRDDGWYVSPFYTLAEFIRESEGYEQADFEASRGDVPGAESPQAAVEALVPAIEELDPEKAVTALPPGEFGFARDYLDSVMSGADLSSLAETRDDLQLEIADLQLADGEDLGDGRQKVEIQGLTYRFHDSDEETVTEVELSGTCADVRSEGEDPQHTCLTDFLAEDAELDPVLAELIPETLFVVAVEDDGQWYVSPMETLAAYLRFAVEKLDDSHLAAFGLVEPEESPLGESVDGELATPFRHSVRTFDLEDGATYLVGVDTPSDIDVGIEVFPVGGDAFGSGTGGAFSGVESPPTTGLFVADGTAYTAVISADRYSVEEDGWDAAVPYTYEITKVEPEGEITLGDPVEVELDAGGEALYEFAATGSQDIVIEVDGDATLAILDPTGYPVYPTIGEATTFYEEGMHLVLVSSAEGGTVTVTFDEAGASPTEGSVEPPESLDGIPEIDLGGVERVTLEEDHIADRIFIGTGRRLRVVAAADDGTFDPILSVFDEDLELIADSPGDASERRAEVVIDTQEGATYVMSVAGYNGVGGKVRLRVAEPE